MNLSRRTYVPDAPTVSLFLILSLYVVRITYNKGNRYVSFSTTVLSCPSWAQIPSLAHGTETPTTYVSHSV